MESRIRIFLLKSAGVLAVFFLLQACSLMRTDEPEFFGLFQQHLFRYGFLCGEFGQFAETSLVTTAWVA